METLNVRGKNTGSKRLDLSLPICDILKGHTIYGPYLSKQDGRKRVHIFDKDGTRFGMLYSKFLWMNANNRWPNADEDIDHKDNDKTNDVIENLVCVNKIVNNSKKSSTRTTTYVKLICIVCDTVFITPITTTHLYHKQVRKHKVTTCNASCKRTFLNYMKANPTVTLETTVLSTFTATKAESDKWPELP